MPIYEYRCESCGHEFERLVKISAPTPDCPECGAGPARKKVSASSFVLQGGGWYRDHYGLKKSSDAGGGASGGSEASKPAAAPAPAPAAAPSTSST
jgi:putative FmdB family regulatory protein